MSMMIDETTNNNGNINIYSLQLRLYNVYYSLALTSSNIKATPPPLALRILLIVTIIFFITIANIIVISGDCCCDNSSAPSPVHLTKVMEKILSNYQQHHRCRRYHHRPHSNNRDDYMSLFRFRFLPLLGPTITPHPPTFAIVVVVIIIICH